MRAETSCAARRRSPLLALPSIVFAAALVGCANLAWPPAKTTEPKPASESALYLDAVRALIGQRQYYAAIAHIEEDRRAHGDSAELRLLEADARRNLKQNKAAESLYHSVLKADFGGPLAGKARHGLGLLYAPVNLDAAVRELREAAKLRPTEPAIRSDLGYALMQQRRFAEARTQLATATELDPDYVPARNNLLILMFAQGDEAGARRLGAAAKLDQTALARLKAQAQSLKTPKRAAPGAKP